MREFVLNFLFIISKVPIISTLFRFYYFLNAHMACFLLNKKENKFIAIKGGYARGDYELITSDIDLVIVSNNFKSSSLLKILCPLVKDVDVYGEEEFLIRLKYGSLKYSDKEKWIVKKGELPKVNYLFYPAKIKIDVIEEIYFYYEWIFENAKLGFGPYRRACMVRNLKKVRSLLPNIIQDGAKLAQINSMDLNHPDSIQKYVECFVNFINHIDIENECEIDDYSLSHFNIQENLPDDYDKIYLTKKMYNLFYSYGCLNTYIIYKDMTISDNKILNHLQVIRYKLKILDGKTNHIHESLSDLNLKEKIDKAQNTLKNFEVFNFSSLYHGKTVFVTASWGNDYLNRLLEAHKMNLNKFGHAIEYLHVSLGGDPAFFTDVKSVTTIRIENLMFFKGLWHKESLFNVAKDFIGDASIYIYSDIDAVIKDSNWLLKLSEELKTKNVVQPFKTFQDEKTKEVTYSSIAALDLSEDVFYAPGLMWAFNYKGMKQLNYFYDNFHDGSNDGVLFKEISKASIGMVEDLEWISQKIEKYISHDKYEYGYLDFQIDHISHPLPKHYINMILFFNLILPLLDKEIQRSDYGLWSWKEEVDSKLQLLFAQFRKDRGYASFPFLEIFKLFQTQILTHKIEDACFYLNDDKEISLTSNKGEVSFFVGSEPSSMSLYMATINEKMTSYLQHKIKRFEKDTSYSISVMMESKSDLSEEVIINVSKLQLMDLKFNLKPLSNNLWFGTVNFYCWQEIVDPIFEIEFNLEKELEVEFTHYQFDKVPTKEWEWFTENKNKVDEKKKKHILRIEKKFSPKWFKAVLKLDDINVSEYKLTIIDSYGANTYLPRVQSPADDYITIFFKPTMNTDYIDIILEFDRDTDFSHDLVFFT